MQIKKTEVDAAILYMENKLYKGRDNSLNIHISPVLRITALFAEAYYQDYFPGEGKIVMESYALLKEKGYYYTEE